MKHSFKQITPTDHFGWHAAYLPVYERLFDSIKRTIDPILEIGTDGGGGLLMYEDWFPNSTIVGVDISPEPSSIESKMRIIHHQCDAYREIGYLAGYGRFALVIDDGPHSIESQEFFVASYPLILNPGGLAVVEDIQHPDHIQRLARHVPDGMMGFSIDLRHVNDRYDDLLFVVLA